MSWCFSRNAQQGKADFVAVLNAREENAGNKVVATSLRGNRLWQVIEATVDSDYAKQGERWINLILLAKQRGGGLGCKSIWERSHPYYFDCPLSLLAKAGTTQDRDALQWRSLVRRHHEHQAKLAKMSAPTQGMVITVGGREYVLEQAHPKPRMGWIAHICGKPHERYRIPATQLKTCLFAKTSVAITN